MIQTIFSEESFYLILHVPVYNPSLKKVKERAQDGNLEAEVEEEIMEHTIYWVDS